LADFGRGIKAGVVTGIIYLVISAILGAIYQNNPFSIPHFLYGTGLTLFTWRLLTDPASVFDLLFQYVIRGIVFGAIFAALYNFLPGTASVKKGVVLSAFVWILSAVGIIYITSGWPTDGISWTYCGGGAVVLSSVGPALAGIISALVFGALTGFLWDRFRPKRLAEARKGSPVLLVSFILGGVIWVLIAVMFLSVVVISRGIPAIDPDFWWVDVLARSVVFLGLPGWVLTLVAWRKAKRGESGFKWGVAGGIMMALTGHMLFPGVLAITGGVFSGRKPASEPDTAEIEQ
jgi:hypothetical protein